MKSSYFEKRLKSLGINGSSDEKNFLSVVDPDTGTPNRYQLFFNDGKGNFMIRYYDLQGRPFQCTKKDGRKWANTYDRIRLAEPEGNKKYHSPAGDGLLPYFTKTVIQAICSGETIDTLYFIEGELKAFIGSENGLPTVGLASNHGFYKARENEHDDKELNPYILDLIRRAKPKKIVLILDADTVSVNYKYNKELSERPISFRASVVNFWKLTSHLVFEANAQLKEIYFGHIQTKFNPEFKGLDDLILGKPEKARNIITEAKNLGVKEEDNSFFYFRKLDQNYYTWANEYFGLTSVENFYETYKRFIGTKEFIYKNAKYYTPEHGKPVFLYHNDVKKFFRIGTSWMKNIQKPDKYGELVEQIVPFAISEITRDYPQNKFPGFIDKIKRFDAYCNEPQFAGEYQREIADCYNLANPITEKPELGTLDVTLKFLKHIFQGNGSVECTMIKNPRTGKEEPQYKENAILGDSFTVGLDYLTLQFKNPKQMLPVPILVSKEFGTGKSTFLKWEKTIYGSNMAILNNEQFKMRFNGHYITKYIIAIDEGFLDVDKKAEKERLKQLVTSDTQLLEFKGVDLQEFYYYGKVILCSNDADSVMRMEDDENRWFVIKVPPVPKGELNPDTELLLKKEIPAWLHFLLNRKVFHPKESRLWFKEEHFITEQFREIVRSTKTRVHKILEETITDQFMNYRCSELRMHMGHLLALVNESSKYKVDKIELKKILKEKLNMSPEDRQRFKIPIDVYQEVGTTEDKFMVETKDVLQRPYVFKIEDWIDEEMMKEWGVKRSDDDAADLPF